MAKRIIPILIVAGLLGGYGYNKWRSRKESENREVYYGTVEATEILVSSQVTGRIIELDAAEGQQIDQDARIAAIDDTLYRAQLKQTKTALETALYQKNVIQAEKEELSKKAERAQKLAKAGVGPAAEYEDLTLAQAVLESREQVAEKQIEQARAGEELVEKQLSYTVISAPGKGRILRVHHEKGETVFSGSPIITIADLSHVEIKVYVPEPMLGKIRLGQKVEVITDTFPDKPLTGSVAAIAHEAEFTPKNVQTREERVRLVYEVTVSTDNPEEILKIGMPVDARFLEE